MKNPIMYTVVLSCDYSIWFVNGNRCGRTGGHAKHSKAWNLLQESSVIKHHHEHDRRLADLKTEPERCSQG